MWAATSWINCSPVKIRKNKPVALAAREGNFGARVAPFADFTQYYKGLPSPL